MGWDCRRHKERGAQLFSRSRKRRSIFHLETPKWVIVVGLLNKLLRQVMSVTAAYWLPWCLAVWAVAFLSWR